MTEDRRSLSAMAITDRTRKILWVKAGGRCSMCRALLVTEGTETDDPSVFGQEAHIVGRSPKGPRAADIPGIDSYANLILLCAKHHKQVDDQREHFTVELLNEIKGKHEEWTATLGETADRDPGPVRLIPDPSRPLKKLLKLIVSGTVLLVLKRESAKQPRAASAVGESIYKDPLENLQNNQATSHSKTGTASK
jgi:hypothetical protein